MNMKKIIATAFFAVGVSAIALMGNYHTPTSQAASSNTYKQLNLFGDVFEKIRSQYVREVTDKELIEAAINGMLTSLDPHSSYMTADSFKKMQVQTKGEFGGLGIEVTMENGVVKVVSPMDGTPAFKAGVKSGDYITRINDEAIVGLTLNQAVAKMRGKVGESIDVTIYRKGEKEPIELTIVRAVIQLRNVSYRIEGKVGYIRVAGFTETTESGLKKALKSIKHDLGDKLQGVVLDLRNNPGGLLNQAIYVSDQFLERGEIVSTRTRNDAHIVRETATKGDALDGKPLVVLINGGSASASEIVAGALQDHDRALVVGVKSFGKGSVQTVMPLDQDAAMRLTTAYYFTPSGTSIQGKGITPDVIVEQLNLKTLKALGAGRRTEADLRGSLKNPNEKKDDLKKDNLKKDGLKKNSVKEKKDQKNNAPDKDKKSDAKNDTGFTTTAQMDYQLNYAMNLVRGMAIARKH
jgi:carboxyl-terminal processing protease